jgi:hypothetical protein
MFQAVTWSPVIAGAVLLGLALFTKMGQRMSPTLFVIIEFAIGLTCSILYVEMFLNLLVTVEPPADQFIAGVRGAWVPPLWAFLVSVAMVGVLRVVRRTSDGVRSRSYA